MQLSWFKHDTDTLNDAKVKKLILRHGAEGYAVYFHCIELIVNDVSENNVSFVLEHDAEIIADNLKIRSDQNISAIDKVNKIMETIIDLGLFEESENKITCLKIAKRLDQSMTSNKQMRKLISKLRVCHDSVMTRHDNVMLEEIRREEIRLDKTRREKEDIPLVPEEFYENNNNFFPYQQLENNTNTNDSQNSDDQEKEKSSAKKEKEKHGEFNNVLLEKEECAKIKARYGEKILEKYIESLSCYIKQIGKNKYKDHYAVILSWIRKDNVPEAMKPKQYKKEYKSMAPLDGIFNEGATQ